jgi:hypothetical protein
MRSGVRTRRVGLVPTEAQRSGGNHYFYQTEPTHPKEKVTTALKCPRGEACKLLPTETVGMTYKYNQFIAAHPSDWGPLGKIFQPVIDYRTGMVRFEYARPTSAVSVR